MPPDAPSGFNTLVRGDVDNEVARLLFDIVGLLGVAIGIIPAAGSAKTELLRQEANTRTPSTLIPLADLAEMHRRGTVDDAAFNNVMTRAGFSERAIDAYRDIEKPILTPIEALTLWLRNELDEASLAPYLKASGIEGVLAEQLKSLAFQVPSAQDVIRFVVREVYSPELRRSLGLDTDFPEGSSEAFKAAGLSDERARNEWAAHWQLPSPQLTFEMLHRRLIDLDMVKVVLRANDVLPLFHEPIIAAAYNPLTRVDVRRMHAVGLLDEQDLVNRYQDVGFALENARMMADFTVLFNDAPDEEEAKEARDLTRAQILAFMRADLFDRETAVEQLTAIGFASETAESITLLEVVAQFQKERDAQVKIIRNRYENGDIEFNIAVEQLDALDLTARERDLLLTEMEAERLSKIQLPTRAELDRFFRENIITKAEYLSSLGAMGYQAPWPERFARFITDEFAGEAKETRRLSQSQIMRFLRAGLVTVTQAQERLAALDFSPGDADLFIELEMLVKPERERELPRGLIVQLMLAGIFQEDEARARLLALGFTADDTDDIISLALME